MLSEVLRPGEGAYDERLRRIVEPNERRGVEAHPSRQQLGVISRK